MASTTNNVSNNENTTSGEEERVDVGTLVFNVSSDDLDKIKAKIGDVLQAQLILRGQTSLGYGKVIFSGPDATNAEGGDITGDARLTRGSRRGRATRGRGARRNTRTRRSADDQEGEESVLTTAANGVTSTISGLVDGVKNLVVGGEGAAEGTTGAAGRGGKAKRGRGAARAARPKRERGEPSKTLVFIRNIPFNYVEEQVKTLFAEHNLSFNSLSMPVWKFGPHKGKGRGYAFATVSSEEEQKKTIDTLNGKEIHTGEMYTPRVRKDANANAAATATAGEGEAPAATEPAAAPEPTERVLKLVARQGYENEEKNTEEQHEEEGKAADAAEAAANGTTGPEDSGTA